MKIFKTILIAVVLVMVSCDNETTLQEYYVENQNDRRFLAVDLPTSLLSGQAKQLSADQRATLETIRKINLIGFPMNEENRNHFEEEKAKLTDILKNEKYKSLMRYGGGTRSAELYYLGNDDAIEEFIVFGSDEEKGFGVARVLGKDMKPENLIKLYHSFEQGDLNVQGLQNFTTMFKD